MKNSNKIMGILKRAFIPVTMVALLASCASEDKEARIRQLEAEKESAQMELQQGYAVVEDMMATLNEVEDNLATIKEKEQIVTLNTEEGEPSERQRKRIIRDIKLINSLLQKSQDQIADLNTQLQRSQIGMEEFKERVAKLDKQLKAREGDIASLKKNLEEKDFQIASLNQTVDGLVYENLQQQAKLVEQDKEMNKAYYAYGTYQDLKEMGVLTKEGGFLWIGQDKVLKEDFNEDYFTEVDKRDLAVIPIYSKKAKLVTEHPEDSYEMVEGEDDYAYLEITDPNEFWKVSNYMVMELK